MHRTGRVMVLVFLRMVLLGIIIMASVGVGMLASYLLSLWVDAGETTVWVLVIASSAVVVAAAVVGLILSGGWALRRYDVAREESWSIGITTALPTRTCGSSGSIWRMVRSERPRASATSATRRARRPAR